MSVTRQVLPRQERRRGRGVGCNRARAAIAPMVARDVRQIGAMPLRRIAPYRYTPFMPAAGYRSPEAAPFGTDAAISSSSAGVSMTPMAAAFSSSRGA
jgi:hypothetical protein